jgi:hypothetical protein
MSSLFLLHSELDIRVHPVKTVEEAVRAIQPDDIIQIPKLTATFQSGCVQHLFFEMLNIIVGYDRE